jgi:hypothetical protein
MLVVSVTEHWMPALASWDTTDLQFFILLEDTETVPVLSMMVVSFF